MAGIKITTQSSGAIFAVTPGHVQSVGSTINDNNGITGNAFEFNGPNVGLIGNCHALWIAYPYSATRTVSISDSTGDTWTLAGGPFGTAASGHMNVRLYLLPNASAGMHTITVTFDAAIKPFQYAMSEFNNIALSSPVDGSSSSVGSGPNISAGSFTPTHNNDSLGGHLILSYAISDDTVGAVFGKQCSSIAATNSAKLLHCDNTGTVPSMSSYLVQGTNAAINSGFTAPQQSTTTNFVCASVALKVAQAGTPRPSGAGIIRIIRILHFTQGFPQTGNNNFQFPCEGNCRLICMAAGSNLNVVNSTTDSDTGGGYQDLTFGAGASRIFMSANKSANLSNVATLNLNAGEIQFSTHMIDIDGAAASPFMNSSGITNGSSPASGTVFNDFPDHTPNANVAGLTVVQTGMGTASPSFGFAAGAPAGAVFDNVFYTGMTDADMMENADPFGHANFSTNAAQTWNWLMAAHSGISTAFCTAVSLKAN